MSGAQVTITLGRSGQVVKKLGSDFDASDSDSDYRPSSLLGKKRSIRDRLGSNEDELHWYQGEPVNKRQRGGVNRGSSSPEMNDTRISPNDLRYKLTRKAMDSKTRENERDQQNCVDLREKLSRSTRPSMRTHTLQDMREPMRTSTQHYLPGPTRISTQQYSPEPMRINSRQELPEPKANGLLKRRSSVSSDDLLDVDRMEPLQTSYSAWTLDRLRRNSPNRKLGASRVHSHPRQMDKLRRISSSRAYDSSRHSPLRGRDFHYAPRPSSYRAELPIPRGSTKPSGRCPPSYAPVITHKSPYTV
ncbi:hypothetical protein GIB67_032933 [Kingdonia uniflora]|uniref:Uncharacterized protein n=1 Tax=Kingdonia uniflora TaxID=39325 RepID=A0A7J7MY18_9MAGN|nr:hypothetical protein GIB67_032933 [Kingdonia uniflora]